MSLHYPVLLVTVPLLSAFIISGLSWVKKSLCFPMALLALGTSVFCAVGLLFRVLDLGIVEYHLGGWMPPWGIAYRVDLLNSLILVAVSSVAFLNLFATHKTVQRDLPEKKGLFYALYVLFVTGLMGITVTGDVFNLYVLLEIASLTAYALIALGDPDRAPLASLNYVFIGTIGACFYLLGIGYLYIMTGSLNMADISSLLPSIYHSKAVLVAFIFCMVGIFIKMAFFPLHAWLPNAYAFAPDAAGSVIAPLMTKVMVYVMIRLIFSVFLPDFTFHVLHVDHAIVWLACLAIVMGSLLALAQRNLKKMLTYIIVSEIGYMVGGVWLGNRLGMSGAILHILNDAIMTLCLFLAAGAIAYKTQGLGFQHLKGLFRKMPVTMAAFVAAGLSVIGVPPTCGFFSKWYLISGAIQAGQYGFMAALLFSSLINVVLFFRVIEIAYYEPMHPNHDSLPQKNVIEEAPLSMLIPLLIVAVSLLVVGIYSGAIVNHMIVPVLPKGIG
ncbi:MAG: monovalent cation/H+ antiporter subunit D family protein [Deltaproteobacteria bacterium]|nr:MAG: monovalent cation/H+ antiporter subunit D family protein [Deltaproteobacteria bacterium]